MHPSQIIVRDSHRAIPGHARHKGHISALSAFHLSFKKGKNGASHIAPKALSPSRREAGLIWQLFSRDINNDTPRHHGPVHREKRPQPSGFWLELFLESQRQDGRLAQGERKGGTVSRKRGHRGAKSGGHGRASENDHRSTNNAQPPTSTSSGGVNRGSSGSAIRKRSLMRDKDTSRTSREEGVRKDLSFISSTRGLSSL